MERGFRLVFFGIIFSLGMVSAQVPFECTGQFYISFTTPVTSSLVEAVIDPVTDQVEFVTINNNLQTFINGAGYRASDNFIYAVEPLNHNLYRIDANGDVQDLGELDLNKNHVYLAGDISPDGKYLVLIGTLGSSSENRDAEIRMIDLTTPGYPVTTRPLTGVDVNMLDIAFDPTDGKLYGVDARENRLVIIGYTTGVVSAPFASTDVMDDAGSLFFDSFGDLYAYGGPPGNNGIQNTLYKVDKTTGAFQILTTGTRAIATDGCSCPHTVELRKEVYPEVMVPCGDVEYVFTIANSSSKPRPNISLQDTLPAGFLVADIVRNPYGGIIRSGVGSGILALEDLTLLPGIDSIIVKVTVGNVADGIYKNQARLAGLPQALGGSVLSDNPRTIIKHDSTALQVQGYPTGILEVPKLLCEGDDIVLDASHYGNTFRWDNGFILPSRLVSEAGLYSVTATTGCDTLIVSFPVEESMIEVAFDPSFYDIRFGDTLTLSPIVTNTGDTTLYRWIATEGDVIPCAECPEIKVVPYRDTEFNVLVSNESGCSSAAKVYVHVDLTRRIFAPNVFSPNGDEVNDEFFLRVRGIATIQKFAIFDRWGNTVYTSSAPMGANPEVVWTGQSGQQPMMPGVYVWVAEVKFADNTVEMLSDNVTLVR